MGGGSGVSFNIENVEFQANFSFSDKTVNIYGINLPEHFDAIGYDDGGKDFVIDDILNFTSKYDGKKFYEDFKDLLKSNEDFKEGLIENLELDSLKGVKFLNIEVCYIDVDFYETRWAGFGGRSGSSIKENEFVVTELYNASKDNTGKNISGFNIEYEINGDKEVKWLDYNSWSDNHLLKQLEYLFENSNTEFGLVAGSRFTNWWTDIFNMEISNDELADTLRYNYEEEIEEEINEYKDENNIDTEITIEEFLEKDLISDELKNRAEEMIWEGHWDYVRGEYC